MIGGKYSMKDEYKKCFYFVLVLNIMSWLLFILFDAIAEIIFGCDMLFDGGLISIPCFLTIFYFVVEKKIFYEIRFKLKFNIFLIFIFAITVFLFGILDFFLLSKNLILVPQKGLFLDGIEYILFPFAYGIISLSFGFIIKITYFILNKIKLRRYIKLK